MGGGEEVHAKRMAGPADGLFIAAKNWDASDKQLPVACFVKLLFLFAAILLDGED